MGAMFYLLVEQIHESIKLWLFLNLSGGGDVRTVANEAHNQKRTISRHS